MTKTMTITPPPAANVAFYEANGVDWAAIVKRAHEDQFAGRALPRTDKAFYSTTVENVLYIKAWMASIKVNGPQRPTK